MAEPKLTILWDEFAEENAWSKDAKNDPAVMAKILSFAYMQLHIFKIILNEMPNPDPTDPKTNQTGGSAFSRMH